MNMKVIYRQQMAVNVIGMGVGLQQAHNLPIKELEKE